MNDKLLSRFKALCLIVTVSSFVACAVLFQKYYLVIFDWIDQLGWFAPILFIVVYGLATILFLPTMVLTLAGGALFGPAFGTLINLLGATFGAAIAFLITRHGLHDWISKKQNAGSNRLISGVNQRGWLFVALLRLFPAIPFSLVNYGMGITGISFRLYLLTTFIFLIPAEIVYTYFGYAGMDALSNPSSFYKNGSMLLCGVALALVLGIKLLKQRKKGRS